MDNDFSAYKPLFSDYTSLTFQISKHTGAIMTKKVQCVSSGHFITEEALNLSRSGMETESAMDLSKTKMVTEKKRVSVIVTASLAVSDNGDGQEVSRGDDGLVDNPIDLSVGTVEVEEVGVTSDAVTPMYGHGRC